MPGDAQGRGGTDCRFKDLNDEQRNLLLSARKEPGKYVEGVVLADKVEPCFNVPLPSLALAMTENTRSRARDHYA